MLKHVDPPAADSPARLPRLRSELAALVLRHLDGPGPRGIDGLGLHRCVAEPEGVPHIYEPSLSFIISGRKTVTIGDVRRDYDESHYLFTTVEMPAFSYLTTSDDAPFLSVMLTLDLDAARAMVESLGPVAASSGAAATCGMATGPMTEELMDALRRLLELIDRPTDIPVLSGLIQREILYRVLTGPAGPTLRRTLALGLGDNRALKALRWLRENFDRPASIDFLAGLSGMGVSTFHHRFRELTALSPLQYQKQLRLHAARRLMLGGDRDAASAAIAVGYESVTQFNREYRRLFGAPPKRDIGGLRAAAAD